MRIKPEINKNVLYNVKRLARVKAVEAFYGEYDMLLNVKG